MNLLFMSQFRQDTVTKHWVLIAPKRALRPESLKVESVLYSNLPEIDRACVFCPGNESLNPDTILAEPSEKKWQVRVVPNKFEALSHNPAVSREPSGFYVTRPGLGDHEVVILRGHNKPLWEQPDDSVETALNVWKIRLDELTTHPETRYVHILHNHGALAGASVAHPHFQIFGVPFIPEHLNAELSGSAAYFRHHGACVYCDMVEKELNDGGRIILDDKDFLVFSLFASRVPFQMRILPKKHTASFSGITVAQRKSLARVLKTTLKKLAQKLNSPSFNFYLHTIPVCSPKPAYCDPNSYHWHIEILPRLNTWAGFELGTEIYVNPVAPEDAAKLLRE